GEELCPEACQPRQTQTGKARHEPYPIIDRGVRAQTAKHAEVTGVRPFIDHTDQEEERARYDAVIKHLQRRPIQRHCRAVEYRLLAKTEMFGNARCPCWRQ